MTTTDPTSAADLGETAVTVTLPGRTWAEILDDRRQAAIAAGADPAAEPGHAPAAPSNDPQAVPVPPIGNPEHPAAVVAGPPAASTVDIDAIAAQVADRLAAVLDAHHTTTATTAGTDTAATAATPDATPAGTTAEPATTAPEAAASHGA
ncbi:MAG TPA: hypothetical protein VFP61_07575 [Acidimicrobiales bacterium]|nr:hypothetical protein [Acidimicrobiales bacterium]